MWTLTLICQATSGPFGSLMLACCPWESYRQLWPSWSGSTVFLHVTSFHCNNTSRCQSFMEEFLDFRVIWTIAKIFKITCNAVKKLWPMTIRLIYASALSESIDIPLKQNSFHAHLFGCDQDSQCTNSLGVGNNPSQNFPKSPWHWRKNY